MSVRRSIIVLTLVILALPAYVFSTHAAQQQAANPPRTLQLHRVGRGNVEQTISAIGNIQPEQVAQLSFTKPGRVAEVLVEPNDYVLAGDVLVRLENDLQQIAYEQAVLDLQSAELELQDLLDGPDEGDIRIAEANIESAWGAYNAISDAVSDEDLQAAQLTYQQAQDALTAANEARRIAGGDSDEAIALLDAQIGEASFNAEIARLRLEALQEGNGPQRNAAYARVVQAQRELDRLLAGPTEQQIEAAELAVQRAQTDLDQATNELARYVLTAPFDGIVGTVDVEFGALVAPAQPVVQFVAVEPLSVTVQVDEIDIRRVREGMPAVITLDALPNVEFGAQIEQISLVGTNVDNIVSYDVEITLNNADPRIHVGMTSEAEISVESRENVLIIPNQYVRLDRRTNNAFVDTISADGTLQEIQVELGLQGDDFSEVLSGLDAGDVIALDPQAEQFSFFGG